MSDDLFWSAPADGDEIGSTTYAQTEQLDRPGGPSPWAEGRRERSAWKTPAVAAGLAAPGFGGAGGGPAGGAALVFGGAGVGTGGAIADNDGSSATVNGFHEAAGTPTSLAADPSRTP